MPWNPAGLFLDEDLDPGRLLDYHTGCVYPQDASSQLPVLLLGLREGETAVDACAAPGSKAGQMALALGDRGLLIACELSASRRRILAENLARQGALCAVVTPLPVGALAAAHPGLADAVLADVPCSGADPGRSPAQRRRMAARQLDILLAAARLARPGGRLVYSTCTPWEEEDEGVILAFLARSPGWAVEPVAAAGTDPDRAGLGALRVDPSRHGSEPFFACRLRAPGEAPAAPLPRQRDAGQRPPEGWTNGADPTALRLVRRGRGVFLAGPQSAACGLAAESRGILAAATDGGLPPAPFLWAAQALIERGAPAAAVPHALASRLWAGEASGPDLPADCYLATDRGAPLGVLGGPAGARRLLVPSRQRRQGLL